tara:strand:+ start:72 stop:272 length:201 start_codon:yes stop_codon:yes gene_type:complete
MINKDAKNLNIKKIKEEIISLKKSLMNLNFQKSTGQLEKTADIKKTKKNIAKLKTQINEKIGENNA